MCVLKKKQIYDKYDEPREDVIFKLGNAITTARLKHINRIKTLLLKQNKNTILLHSAHSNSANLRQSHSAAGFVETNVIVHIRQHPLNTDHIIGVFRARKHKLKHLKRAFGSYTEL